MSLTNKCTKTVTGEKWLQDHMSSLDETLKKQVQVNSSSTGFTFGDGRKVYSRKKVQIPAMVAGKMRKIAADVIAEDIPLLLSKTL